MSVSNAIERAGEQARPSMLSAEAERWNQFGHCLADARTAQTYIQGLWPARESFDVREEVFVRNEMRKNF